MSITGPKSRGNFPIHACFRKCKNRDTQKCEDCFIYKGQPLNYISIEDENDKKES